MRRAAIASGVAVLALVAPLAGCGDSPEPVPYTDERSTGTILLYDGQGNAKTSGKITDKPFVARAVSQSAAPAPYDAAGRKATLMAFQPREGVSPQLWTGTFLTGANTYDDPARPTVNAPEQGLSLKEFIDQYPTRWNGLVQLRIFLGVPGEPTLNNKYATADIKINGDTWTQLSTKSQAMVPVAQVQREDVPIFVSVTASPVKDDAGDLPRTGTDIVVIAAAGAALVGLGVLLVAVARRRTRRG